MELHQLEYFLAVVDTGGFTAAARAVRISQSGVSVQLRKLEAELGLTLLDRTSRRVALTPEGERLVPLARRAVEAVAEIEDAARDIRGLVVGSLRVATVTGLSWPRFYDALSAMHTRHPGVDLHLHEGTSDDLLSEVRAGRADVAVAAWADAAPDDLRSALVVDDPLVAVVAAGHPLARRDAVTAEELADADLISLPLGTGARAALDALMLRRSGRRAEPRWDVATPAHVAMLASRGLGVGVLSATTAADADGTVSIPLDDAEARSRLGVVWREAPSTAARVLLSLLDVPH